MNFITKKHLPRRTFLRGAGATIALPFLESMLPAQTAFSQTPARPTRFLGVFAPHGWAPGFWMPITPEEEKDNLLITSNRVTGMAGKLDQMPFIFTPLEPYKEYLTIIAGLDSNAAMAPAGASGGDHNRAAAFLTGDKMKKTSGEDLDVRNTSIDQEIAKKIGQDTPLPSMQFGIEGSGGNTSGTCGAGYACAYMNSISWSDRYSPMPMEISPHVIFERMFGSGSTPEERERRRRNQISVLDGVTRKVSRLKVDLPASDRRHLDSYLENVREIERRLEIAKKASVTTVSADLPFGFPDAFSEHVRLHWDLMLTAFQGDLSRVATIMLARDISPRAYPDSGVTAGNHPASHYGDGVDSRLQYAKINRYFMQEFAYLVKKLKETPDGDGSLLDHSLTLWGSTMGKSANHDQVNVGHFLFGGASGQHKGGRYVIQVTGHGDTSDLLLTTMDFFGIHKERLGLSTKRVSL